MNWQISKHDFLIENAGKDISLEQMFEWMYCIDLNEKGTQIGKIDRNIEQLSKNDKGFLGP